VFWGATTAIFVKGRANRFGSGGQQCARDRLELGANCPASIVF
jgi:hypothetical protein